MNNFTVALIEGLWKIRNREDGHSHEYRAWLRMAIGVERRRRARLAR